jgi:hypothetical protein
MNKIATAKRLCKVVATLGVLPSLKAILSAKKKAVRVDLANLHSLSILGRIQRIIAGSTSWDFDDTGFPRPDWYLNPTSLKVRTISPIPDFLKGLDTKVGSPPLFDKGNLTSEELVVREVNRICDILEMPLHELINMAVSDSNKVYQVLAQELLQRDPTEEFTPKTINFRRITLDGIGS